MEEDTVNPIEEVKEDAQEAVEEQETQVPLSALQKERKKRQEIEIENRLLKEQNARREQPVEDDRKYESATKEDLGLSEQQILRKVEERSWIKQNPEKYEKVNELLPDFLKKRPNLASAIEGASNRYEEAWELMDKLSPKEQKSLKATPPVKKDTPGSPTAVSKAAALDNAVDVMSMSDKEFAQWRSSKKRAR